MLTDLPDDGLYMPEIALHSLKKIEIHDYYVALFSAAMKDRWPQRAYVGLYAGAGRARVRGSGQIVETTPLGAIRSAPPFTKYIFVDQDPVYPGPRQQDSIRCSPPGCVPHPGGRGTRGA